MSISMFPTLKSKSLTDFASRDLIDEFFSKLGTIVREDRIIPNVEITEDSSNVFIKAELPGINKENVSVSVENNVLTIAGEKKLSEEKSDKNYILSEIKYGTFSRSYQLPKEIDQNNIDAKYENGVINVILPKIEKESSKQIKIN